MGEDTDVSMSVLEKRTTVISYGSKKPNLGRSRAAWSVSMV